MIFKKAKRNEKPRYESIYFDNKDLIHALSDCVSLIVCTIEKNGYPIKRITLNDGRCFDEKKHGEWVEEPDRRFHWHCSECGYVIGVVKMDCNYCPKCGARMDGEEDEID